MNNFDSAIMDFLNGISHTSKSFDDFMVFIVDNNFVKGVAIVSLLWFFWFQKSSKITFNRERVIICIVSCFVSIFIARAMALSLPFRLRPILNPNIDFVKPFGTHALDLGTWSSFPSDNAVMFFSLATGIFLISKRIGFLTYLYVLVVICFPRIYLGYHFATDILVGAIIGVLITYLFSIEKISQPIIRKVFQFSDKYTGLFYTLCFLLIYEISRMFHEIRWAGSYLLHFLHNTI
jgi:undecaprenyl-diphosphatase